MPLNLPRNCMAKLSLRIQGKFIEVWILALPKSMASFVRILPTPKLRSASRNGKNARIMRSLEIIEALGKVPKFKMERKYDTRFIGIKRTPKELKGRIDRRIREMLKKGLIREVQELRRSGISGKRFSELGFEYKYPALYLQKKITREEMIAKINKETVAYARRQMLWWKNDKRIKWLKK